MKTFSCSTMSPTSLKNFFFSAGLGIAMVFQPAWGWAAPQPAGEALPLVGTGEIVAVNVTELP